jgi:hypothetical protein
MTKAIGGQLQIESLDKGYSTFSLVLPFIDENRSVEVIRPIN